MANTQDDDMYLFQSGLELPNTGFAGQDFDTFLTGPDPEQEVPADTFLNPNDLVKKEQDSPAEGSLRFSQSHRGSDTSSSSSEAFKYHNRNNSEVSASSSAFAQAQKAWGSGINGFSMPLTGQTPEDASMSGLDQDFDLSNQQMASDFDFETAASTPSGYNPANARSAGAVQPLRRTMNTAQFGQVRKPSNNIPTAGPPAFFFAGSREVSPLNAMLPAQAQSPWNKHSPSAGLEETFNHINMNGDSPGNATFSPNMPFPGAGYSFDADSSATPSSFEKAVSSPPSTVNSIDGQLPRLTVHPTSLKSRVETQIPIKLTLSFLPNGVKKLRLPTHTVSKPKFLIKGDVERSPEILELSTSLVCTSAMQDPVRLQRALARARGEQLDPYTRPSPASSTTTSSSQDDEDRPLNGGEVRICTGCIQRERKRASRKKQKKPEEEEIFQRDEERRVVVFNTNEIKEWAEIPKDQPPSPQPQPASAMQVELPMRIACYCRHQNEKLGFQVIFTIKDYRERVVAQALTNPIMITDDHKTHNAPAPVQQIPAPLPTAPQVPGAGVFSTAGNETTPTSANMPKMFKQSFSTNDLHGLQHNFNQNFPMSGANNPFAIPPMPSQTSSTMTPRNLSRPASPSGPSGPTAKKRKQSGSGKLPSGLTMTRLDNVPNPAGSNTMPNSAASSPYASNTNPFTQANSQTFNIAPARPNGTSPPTPNGNDPYATTINRSFSLENLPRQAMMSAPSSRQPSRPGSPTSRQNSFGATDPNFSQAVSNQLLGHAPRRPPPLIHKMVPAEGSISGGTEVTLLGNGFYQGLEVMFGDTEATTTTFWGEKCLNCITPPAVHPGTVAVVFKHEHPQYSAMAQQSQRHTVFTYTDDRELEMFRLALRTIGKQMQHPTDDPYSTAQQLIQQQSMWSSQGNYSSGHGHQRHAGMSSSAPMDALELETTMVQLLEYIDLNAPSGLQRLDFRRPSGMSLLHLAASLGLTRFVAGLLARGANPNLTDRNGHTPMHHAAMHGHTHVIHRLRMSGASHRARSIRNFTPADLATSLLAFQAALTPPSHYRSRSVGGTPMQLQSRRGSSASLRSFWENGSTNYYDSFSDDSEDTEAEESSITEESRGGLQVGRSAPGMAPSRRGSAQHNAKALAVMAPPAVMDAAPNGTPSAFMLAWRDHLVNQLHQFNESAQSVMPSLPTLNGPLQALQEYQAPMVRRVSMLFPQRPSSRQREGWWESITGSSAPATSAPPAYGDLYPEQEPAQEDWSLKKTSAMQAAADAIADSHFGGQSSVEETKTKPPHRNTLVTRQPIERVELSRDRKLFFFWVSDSPYHSPYLHWLTHLQIPILAIVLGLMIRNSGLIEFVTHRSQDIIDIAQPRAQEAVEVL